MLKKSLLNVFFRGATLIGKFLLVFFIARYLSAESMGLYGLMTTSVGVAVYFLGMDFYVYNTREILQGKNDDRLYMIRDQFIFHVCVYLLILPALCTFFVFGFLPWKYAYIYFVILIFEHLSQEISRIMIALFMPVWSNFLQFLKTGLWPILVVFCILVYKPICDIRDVFYFWAVGVVLSFGVGIYILYRQGICLKTNRAINWKWIRIGCYKSALFFCGTLAFLIVQHIDKYIIKYYFDDSLLGVYSFFANIANVINVFVSNGIVMLIYPEMIKTFKDKRHEEYNKLVKKLTVNTISASLLIGFFAVIGIEFILQLIAKDIYFENLAVYMVLVVASVINVLAQIPHYILYSHSKDKEIFYATIIAAGSSCMLNFFFVPTLGILGAALSNGLAMILLLCTKSWQARSCLYCNDLSKKERCN